MTLKPIIAAALLAAAAPAAAATDLITLYKDLHSHPELAFHETRTAALLAAEARAAGFTVTEKVGGTGVVAIMVNGPGPVLLIRTDMDALPVPEATGLPYASLTPGSMHACGHDVHMTAWVGLARALAANKAHWSGTVMMVGQPAEEIVGGAAAMLKDGLYTRFPKPTAALAFHDSAALPAGTVAVLDGYVLANVDSVDIVVHGIGSHGSEPQLGIDPVVLASRIVLDLQTLISREKDPRAPAVITVGTFHAGTKRNIISDEARLGLTIRSYDQPTRERILLGIGRMASADAVGAGVAADKLPEVTLGERSDATFNDPAQTPKVRVAIAAALGADKMKDLPPSMAAEDFGKFGAAAGAPSTMFWVGAQPQAVFDAAKGDQRAMPGLHSARFAPDAPLAIDTGVKAMTAAALALLGTR